MELLAVFGALAPYLLVGLIVCCIAAGVLKKFVFAPSKDAHMSARQSVRRHRTRSQRH